MNQPNDEQIEGQLALDLPGDLVPGVKEGIRFWHVDANGNLHSVGAPNHGKMPWSPGVNEARCLADLRTHLIRTWKNGPDGIPVEEIVNTHGPIPSPTCACGFWMLKTLEEAYQRAWRYGSGPTILGRIKAWGRICEGSEGDRVEFAEVVELFADKGHTGNLAQKAADRYGVPLTEMDVPNNTKSGDDEDFLPLSAGLVSNPTSYTATGTRYTALVPPGSTTTSGTSYHTAGHTFVPAPPPLPAGREQQYLQALEQQLKRKIMKERSKTLSRKLNRKYF